MKKKIWVFLFWREIKKCNFYFFRKNIHVFETVFEKMKKSEVLSAGGKKVIP
jgi:hypothetical protein